MTRPFVFPVFMFRIFALFIVFFVPVLFSAIIDVSAAEPTSQNFLTHTLNEPIGMQGFDGEYALGEPYEIVEIVVQFRTPPAVALRLIQEQGGIHGFSEAAFEQQALAAHEAFHSQLNSFPIPLSSAPPFEVFSEHHTLFNGVYMRVSAEMVEMIAALPEVFGVFPNLTPHPAYAPATESFAESFFVNPELMRVAREYLGICYINNELGLTGYSVRVGVLDTGIAHNHPEFVRFQDPATGLIRGGERADNTYSPTGSGRAHGTTVSGALIGIAPNVELWKYRLSGLVDGGGMTFAAAFEAARDDGVQVMNLSFSYLTVDPFHHAIQIVNLAVMDGMVVVVGAGNHGPNSYTVFSPSAAALAITVGAGNAGHVDAPWTNIIDPPLPDSLRDYSSRGPARGTHNIKPDIIVTTGVLVPTINGYAPRAGGTSHSAPIIAGLAALFLQQNPNAAPWEIKARIMNTARPMQDVNPNSVFSVGAGFAQPLNALTQNAFATAEHSVLTANIEDEPFEIQTMASLSFGRVFDDTVKIPVTIHNAGREEWIPHFIFNGTHHGVNFFIEPTGANTFAAFMTFDEGTEYGLYEGNLIFTSGAGRITMPFAVMFDMCIPALIGRSNTITGFVYTAAGGTIMAAGATVTLVDMETGERVAATTTFALMTEARGFYYFTDVPNGTYRLVVSGSSRSPAISNAIVMDNDFHAVNLTSSSSGMVHMILVRLTGLPNQNPPGTDVYFNARSFAAPAEGAADNFWSWRVTLASPAITGTITATSPGFLPAEQQVTADDFVDYIAIVTLHLIPEITINTHPANASVVYGEIDGELFVDASAMHSTTLSYQWFSNTTASNTGGTAIPGANAATFAIPSNLPNNSTHFFYVVVSVAGAESIASNVATVTVGFGTVPPTGTPNIIGMIAAMFVFLAISAVSWRFVFLRKPRRNNSEYSKWEAH